MFFSRHFIALATATALTVPASAVAQNYTSGNSPTAFEIARNQDSVALAFSPGVEENLPRKTIHRLKRAAERGETDAMVRLGLMKISGRSVEQDEIGGWNLLLKAADAGHAQASLIVGTSFMRGTHIRADIEKAEYWLLRASESDYYRVRRDAEKILASMN